MHYIFILRIRQLSRRFLLACRGGTKTIKDQNGTKIPDAVLTKIEHLFVEADGSCLATMIQTFAAKNSLKTFATKNTFQLPYSTSWATPLERERCIGNSSDIQHMRVPSI